MEALPTPVLPLKGLKVLEVGSRASAAFAGRYFADNGAAVTRLSDGQEPLGTDSPWPHLDRGQDIVRYEGGAQLRDALAMHIAEADLVISDLLPEELAAVGWDDLDSPRLSVRASITPMGRSGPDSANASTALTLLARSGHTFLMGDPDREPLTLPREYVAYQAGLYTYAAVLAAWLANVEPGAGPATSIEVCELEVLATLHQHTTVMYSYSGRTRRRRGNQYDGTYPITIVPCADGWLGLCITAPFWEPFARWLNPAWLTDPRFKDSPSRWEHRDLLDQEMHAAIASLDRRTLERDGQITHRVPVGAVDTPADLLADPHLNERAFWTDAEVGGRRVRYPGVPFMFEGEGRPGAGSAAPVVEAHR